MCSGFVQYSDKLCSGFVQYSDKLCSGFVQYSDKLTTGNFHPSLVCTCTLQFKEEFYTLEENGKGGSGKGGRGRKERGRYRPLLYLQYLVQL